MRGFSMRSRKTEWHGRVLHCRHQWRWTPDSASSA